MFNINCHCYGILDNITNEVNSLLSQIINAEKEASRFKWIWYQDKVEYNKPWKELSNHLEKLIL